MKMSPVVFRAMPRIVSVTISIALLQAQIAFASSKPAPVSAPKAPAPAAVSVNPDTLRQQVLESNLSITESLNSVKDGKDQVSVARGNLLPSLNLGAMITSTGSFLLSTIQFLVPFLIPSNWFNYKAQKQVFEADKDAFYILELNTYSSALSLYYTMLSDQATTATYVQEAADYATIAHVADRLAQIGAANPNDNLQLHAQAELANVQASQLTEMVAQETSSLRQALALPITTKITLQQTDEPASAVEAQDIQTTITQAFNASPEHQQITVLTKAAQDKKWATVFGFINGGTLSSNGNGSGNASLSGLNTGMSINLGFSLFPEIKLANRNIQEVNLLDTELMQSDIQVLESAINSLNEAKNQYNQALEAENNLTQAMKVKEAKFRTGSAQITDVIVARTQLVNASLARIKAEMDVNLQRTVLNRTMLTAEFTKIKGCQADPNVKTNGKSSLDTLCRPEAQPAASNGKNS